MGERSERNVVDKRERKWVTDDEETRLWGIVKKREEGGALKGAKIINKN